MRRVPGPCGWGGGHTAARGAVGGVMVGGEGVRGLQRGRERVLGSSHRLWLIQSRPELAGRPGGPEKTGRTDPGSV